MASLSPPSTGLAPAKVEPDVELFANALDDCLGTPGTASAKRASILRLVSLYHNSIAARLESLSQSLLRDAPTIQSDSNDMDLDDADDRLDLAAREEEMQKLEQEARIWDLLRRILPLRYPDQNPRHRTSRPQHSEDGGLWGDFLRSDAVASERAAVLKWLQCNTQTRPDIDDIVRELQQNADRGDIIAHGWLHTRSAIKLRKSIQAWPHPVNPDTPVIAPSLLNADNAPLVTQLDPDAMTRQSRRLEPQDEYFERAIWLGCFEMLRRGSSLKEIREWCLERTEVWRAVSMSAFPGVASEEAHAQDEDASSLALWRRMCFALARQGGTDDYERAVYGVLSGDLSSVETVCQTWDDFAFANYNALLRSQFDTFLLSRCPPATAAGLGQAFGTFDAIQFHGNPAALEEHLFKSLETNERTRAEALEPMISLQAAIISRDLDYHLAAQGSVLSHKANEKRQSKLFPPGILSGDVDERKFVKFHDFTGLRIMCHVLIVKTCLDRLGLQGSTNEEEEHLSREAEQENVISAYVSYLRLAGLEELIPLYCSMIGGERAYPILCRNLTQVTEQDDRMLQLNLIRKAGLDPLKFVRQMPALLLRDHVDPSAPWPRNRALKIMEDGPPHIKYGRPIKTDFFGDDEDEVDHSDELLIRSLEWLMLVEGATSDAFSVGSKVYKHFLKNLHLNAARALSQRVSFAEIMGQKMGQPLPEDFDEAWFDDAELWDGNGAAALDARNFWEFESLVKALDVMETIASMAELSKEEQQSSKRDFWNKVGNDIKSAKSYIRPLLQGWLVIGMEQDKELENMRSIYLPETILAYVSTLHFAGAFLSRDNLLEVMELAAVIAEKGSDVAVCFVKAGRMKELVEAFASGSKALAIAQGEKKGGASSSKKLREMGWSRDLWSVRP